MTDYVTLTCPRCGGKLEITNDIERFACGYCGQEHIVRRGGGIVSLTPIASDVRGIKIGVDKTAAELALVRLAEEKAKQIQERSKVIPDFYDRHIRDGNSATLNDEVYRLIKTLINKVDGKGISILLNNYEVYELLKNRILNLSMSDLDYLVENALDDSGGKKIKNKEKFEVLIDELSRTRQSLLEFDEKIKNIEKEIERNEEIVSS
ncbi:MAG: hypothetical protein ACOX7C_02335 [Brevefilum sp.]|jgi:DNA-directed RNA polymerase subunit RPC12/RpoP